MTKRQLLRKTKLTMAAIARVLGISRIAVSKWPMDAPLPPLRLLQLQQVSPTAPLIAGTRVRHKATAEEIQAVYSFFNPAR